MASAEADGEVSNRGVFSFARAVRHDAVVAIFLCQENGVDSFAERADLVWLDEDGVSGLHVDAFLEKLRIGNEEVVADELDTVAEALGKHLPAVPVVFAEAVLDGDYWVVVGNPLVPVGEIFGRFVLAVGL